MRRAIRTSRRTSSDIATTCRPCRSTASAKLRASLGVMLVHTSRILSDTSLKLCFSSFHSSATKSGGCGSRSAPSDISSLALPFAGKAFSNDGCRLMLSTTSGPMTSCVCLGACRNVSSRKADRSATNSPRSCCTFSGTIPRISSSVCSPLGTCSPPSCSGALWGQRL